MSSSRTKLPSVAMTVEPVPHATRLGRIDDTQTLPGGAYDGLPGQIVEIAEIAGLQAALTIANARGGNRVYIPATADDDHWLVTLIGRDAANKLMGYYATGVELDMPRGPTGLRADTWRRLYRMIEDGCTSTQITRALGISRDMVKHHRAKLRNSHVSPQLDMFAPSNGEERLGSRPVPPATNPRYIESGGYPSRTAHVLALKAAGMTTPAIAKSVGVLPKHVETIIRVKRNYRRPVRLKVGFAMIRLTAKNRIP